MVAVSHSLAACLCGLLSAFERNWRDMLMGNTAEIGQMFQTKSDHLSCLSFYILRSADRLNWSICEDDKGRPGKTIAEGNFVPVYGENKIFIDCSLPQQKRLYFFPIQKRYWIIFSMEAVYAQDIHSVVLL